MGINIVNIIQIDYNWHHTEDGMEDFYCHKVGKRGVTCIDDITEDGKGLYLYRVCFENGKMQLIFNPNKIYIEQVKDDDN